jgi:flagellar protein FliO/FliZ
LAIVAWLPVAVFAKDEVIYPRSAAPANAPAENSTGSTRNMVTGLLGIACVAGAGWIYWRNRSMGGSGPGRSVRKLTIAETRPLGNRQHLLVADYDGKKYLLGVCPGRIDLLTALNEDERDAKT